MSGIITTLKKENLQNLPNFTGNYVYPVTVLDAIYDNNGNLIKINFEEINNKLGLLEDTLNDIEKQLTLIEENINNIKQNSSESINLLDNLENRLLKLEELRQKTLYTATVQSDILTDSNNINGLFFVENFLVNDELLRIRNLLIDNYRDFNIGTNGFLLTAYNSNFYYYTIAIFKNINGAFNNPTNWYVIYCNYK